MTPPRNCPNCNKPILGRLDKKYCSGDCRALANRQHQRTARQSSLAINKILWRNREILRSLWPERPVLITRDYLISHGYQLQFYTNIHVTTNRLPYYVCYDFGFQPSLKAGVRMALVVKMTSHASPDPWDFTNPSLKPLP